MSEEEVKLEISEEAPVEENSLEGDTESFEEEDTEEEEKTMSESERVRKIAAVIPMHDATGPLKRGRGRPRKVNIKPTASDLEYHSFMVEEKSYFIDLDELVQGVSSKKEASTILHMVKLELAREAAALKFQRIELEKRGVDSAQTSSRHISALREVANIELEIKKLGAGVLDLKSERFQKVIQMFVETIKEVAQDTLTGEQFDMFFNKLGSALEGWEERAESVIR